METLGMHKPKHEALIEALTALANKDLAHQVFDPMSREDYQKLRFNADDALEQGFTIKHKEDIVAVGHNHPGRLLLSEPVPGLLSESVREVFEISDPYADLRGLGSFEYSMLTQKQREANIVPVRSEEKIGRNTFCHCESGKKYKKCCMTADKTI